MKKVLKAIKIIILTPVILIFAASGNLGQNIYVIPDKEIIIVHCGNSLQYYGDNDLWQVADKMREMKTDLPGI